MQEPLNVVNAYQLRYHQQTSHGILKPPTSAEVPLYKHPITPLNKTRCYTCKPKRLALEHVFFIDEQRSVKYHFDMIGRPFIIVTPTEHVSNVQELSNKYGNMRLQSIFDSINDFCGFWNIKDYQLQLNHGKWQHHNHLHLKLKVCEDFVQKIRSDHFKFIKMSKLLNTSNTANTSNVT